MKDPFDSYIFKFLAEQKEINKILAEQNKIDEIIGGRDRHHNLFSEQAKFNALSKSLSSIEPLITYSLYEDLSKKASFENINKTNRWTSVLETQNHISQLLSSFHGLENNHNAFNTSTDKLMNQLESLRAFEDISQKLSIWNQAIEIQKNYAIDKRLERSIYGLNINEKLFQAFHAIAGYDDIERQLEMLNQGNIFLGEYDIEDESGNEGSRIILPEEIHGRMDAVNFLPIKVFDKIRKDPQLMHTLSPRDFEFFIAEIYDKMGLDVVITPRSNDKGRDIIATKIIGGTPIILAVECKKYAPKRPIKPEIMRALLGTVTHSNTKANKGVLVTTSSFSKGSRSLIASEAMIDGKDFNDIVIWLNNVGKTKT